MDLFLSLEKAVLTEIPDPSIHARHVAKPYTYTHLYARVSEAGRRTPAPSLQVRILAERLQTLSLSPSKSEGWSRYLLRGFPGLVCVYVAPHVEHKGISKFAKRVH